MAPREDPTTHPAAMKQSGKGKSPYLPAPAFQFRTEWFPQRLLPAMALEMNCLASATALGRDIPRARQPVIAAE